MNKSILCFVFLGLVTACDSVQKNTNEVTEEKPKNELIGTWELISNVIYQGDSVINHEVSDARMIKIINETHFAFLNHDLKKGADSTNVKFVAGGGSYTLEGNQYAEKLEYCNYREWENHDFEFTLEFKNDTLIQSGIEKLEALGIEQKIVETYVRTTK